MAKLWRLQTNTDSADGKKIGDYCLNNKVLALGWSLKDSHLSHLEPEALAQAVHKRSAIRTFEDYADFLQEFNVYGGKVDNNVDRFCHRMETDDLVWIRQDGIYYLGRVTEDSRWKYCADDEALSLDAANQVDRIEWICAGDESEIPGAISTALIRGKTLENIWKPFALEYSQLLYNSKTGEKHYSVSVACSRENFYSLLSTDDCEDLLCLWLYHKYGYVCIPSTNKKSTELYECVLVDPKTGKHIYPQAKAGEADLCVADYAHLPGEVWLFTTRGSVIGEETETVKIANPQELFEFVSSPDAAKILPSHFHQRYEILSARR